MGVSEAAMTAVPTKRDDATRPRLSGGLGRSNVTAAPPNATHAAT